jgi:hypothetical protein
MRQTGDLLWPRYLTSFAQRIVHPMDDPNSVDPLVPAVRLYDSFGHNDADMVDHVSSIRFITDPDTFWLGVGVDWTC